MRVLKSTVGWPGVGWLWPLALLALSNCAFDKSGTGGTTDPLTTAVFCDIQLPLPDGRHCASPTEEASGVFLKTRQANAALFLNTGQNYPTTLDDSLAARTACGGPQAVAFKGGFPFGQGFCADPLTLTDPDAFCVEKCKGYFPDPADAGVAAFCADNARASTNVPHTITAGPDFSLPGFPGGCTSEGTVLVGDKTPDPRIVPEPVRWTDFAGVGSLSGSDLTRIVPATGSTTADFNAGAASAQWITHGDAYVEFSAKETNKSHVVGLSEIPDGCVFPCFDSDHGLTDINFGISLNSDGLVYIIESGALVPGDFGPYSVGERYRVSLRHFVFGANTALVTYSRRAGPCTAGTLSCAETLPFFTHVGLGFYAFRVDASFREQDATVSDVRIMRIK